MPSDVNMHATFLVSPGTLVSPQGLDTQVIFDIPERDEYNKILPIVQ